MDNVSFVLGTFLLLLLLFQCSVFVYLISLFAAGFQHFFPIYSIFLVQFILVC